MSLAIAAALILLLAGLVGARRRFPTHLEPIVLQGVAVILLGLTLFPPLRQRDFDASTLVLLTPGITPQQLATLPDDRPVVALSGVAAPGSVESAPDLGTALRRHPQIRRLHIIGNGLPARDHDAVDGFPLQFDPAPPGAGLDRLERPGILAPGQLWRVSGRVLGLAGGHVELRDPAGTRLAAQELDEDGEFNLAATTRLPGKILHTLDVFDPAGQRVDGATIPVITRAPVPLRGMLFAAAPSPELKFLRRWAIDAGIRLDSHIGLGADIALREGEAELAATALRDSDLVIFDERAWGALTAAEKSRLLDAVRDGLGLLLRITGEIPDEPARDWANFGISLRPRDGLPSVHVAHVASADDPPIALQLQALDVEGRTLAPVLRADDGTPLAWMQPFGRGRIVVWRLADSHRLMLGGARSSYENLWSTAMSAVSRPIAEHAAKLSTNARVDLRSILCDLDAISVVEDPTGHVVPLLPDAQGCASWWPALPGWHTLRSAETFLPVHVEAADATPRLQAGETRRATARLVSPVATRAPPATHPRPMPRSPFFLAFLALVARLWWHEKANREPLGT